MAGKDIHTPDMPKQFDRRNTSGIIKRNPRNEDTRKDFLEFPRELKSTAVIILNPTKA